MLNQAKDYVAKAEAYLKAIGTDEEGNTRDEFGKSQTKLFGPVKKGMDEEFKDSWKKAGLDEKLATGLIGADSQMREVGRTGISPSHSAFDTLFNAIKGLDASKSESDEKEEEEIEEDNEEDDDETSSSSSDGEDEETEEDTEEEDEDDVTKAKPKKGNAVYSFLSSAASSISSAASSLGRKKSKPISLASDDLFAPDDDDDDASASTIEPAYPSRARSLFSSMFGTKSPSAEDQSENVETARTELKKLNLQMDGIKDYSELIELRKVYISYAEEHIKKVRGYKDLEDEKELEKLIKGYYKRRLTLEGKILESLHSNLGPLFTEYNHYKQNGKPFDFNHLQALKKAYKENQAQLQRLATKELTEKQKEEYSRLRQQYAEDIKSLEKINTPSPLDKLLGRKEPLPAENVIKRRIEIANNLYGEFVALEQRLKNPEVSEELYQALKALKDKYQQDYKHLQEDQRNPKLDASQKGELSKIAAYYQKNMLDLENWIEQQKFQLLSMSLSGLGAKLSQYNDVYKNQHIPDRVDGTLIIKLQQLEKEHQDYKKQLDNAGLSKQAKSELLQQYNIQFNEVSKLLKNQKQIMAGVERPASLPDDPTAKEQSIFAQLQTLVNHNDQWLDVNKQITPQNQNLWQVLYPANYRESQALLQTIPEIQKRVMYHVEQLGRKDLSREAGTYHKQQLEKINQFVSRIESSGQTAQQIQTFIDEHDNLSDRLIRENKIQNPGVKQQERAARFRPILPQNPTVKQIQTAQEYLRDQKQGLDKVFGALSQQYQAEGPNPALSSKIADLKRFFLEYQLILQQQKRFSSLLTPPEQQELESLRYSFESELNWLNAVLNAAQPQVDPSLNPPGPLAQHPDGDAETMRFRGVGAPAGGFSPVPSRVDLLAMPKLNEEIDSRFPSRDYQKTNAQGTMRISAVGEPTPKFVLQGDTVNVSATASQKEIKNLFEAVKAAAKAPGGPGSISVEINPRNLDSYKQKREVFEGLGIAFELGNGVAQSVRAEIRAYEQQHPPRPVVAPAAHQAGRQPLPPLQQPALPGQVPEAQRPEQGQYGQIPWSAFPPPGSLPNQPVIAEGGPATPGFRSST